MDDFVVALFLQLVASAGFPLNRPCKPMVAAPTPLRETVFVTHAAPEDNEFALWLSAKLAIAGYRVWVDRRLRGGDDFWDEIDRVLVSCDPSAS